MFAIWFLLLPPLLGAGFYFCYRHNKMSIIPSYFLSLFTLTSVSIIMSYLHAYLLSAVVFRILFLVLLLPLALLFAFGVYALIFILLSNAYLMLQRERRSLAHALTLILAICFIGLVLFTRFVEIAAFPYFIQVFFYLAYFLLAFYLAHITHYVLASILVNRNRPRYEQDYIIIHGSGLVNGAVSPLLAARVDRAIAFYQAQAQITHAPKLILSGGQGSDEPISEAQAMMTYAAQKGVPKNDMLLEDKSATTLQNIIYSKQIMDARAAEDKQPYRCIFSTSNYHLLRTGMYAKIAGLKLDGIGAKTAPYYLPNALIREYIAYVVMQKKRHATFILLCLFCAAVMSISLAMLA